MAGCSSAPAAQMQVSLKMLRGAVEGAGAHAQLYRSGT